MRYKRFIQINHPSDKHFNNHINHSIAAMVTSIQHSSWPLDVTIENLKMCGLSKPSVIRFKLFTIDHRLIRAKIGTLAEDDRLKIRENLSLALVDLWNYDDKAPKPEDALSFRQSST